MKSGNPQALNTRDDIFKWKELSITQSDLVFKIGTDAILLASWIPELVQETDCILDAGTGTGILAMAMSHAYPNAIVDAIDIDENAVSLARDNFNSMPSFIKMNAMHQSVFEKSSKKYDLVICNPPYYFGMNGKGINTSNIARHAMHTVREWIIALEQNLLKSGHLFLVVPSDKAYEWISSANESGLYCMHRLNVFSRKEDLFPVRALLHFTGKLCRPEQRRIDLYDETNHPTPGYIQFTGVQFTGSIDEMN